MTRKLFKGIYTPNSSDVQPNITNGVADYIMSSGNYKDQSLKLYEMFSKESKKPRKLDPLQLSKSLQNSPRQQISKIFKDIKEKAELLSDKTMTA